ncbi:MBL fold metallo-hydrolase [Notoacmeibacter sp. MSK16QG-6]|uniref:MBL fold metallo-hydrolase n=1 Tax=Notoacmeibacter sp. MSK16QG-6 TaxID=2957982 RepID=UPI00209DC57F|nr:MBL fold metallo-hydrolase [Notoacmeibacter sp. MSK16QG-6]MCP1198358.1 MBL fold metallo-hydrolase [Notoacmeibacter sp. MSK16QG-6]
MIQTRKIGNAHVTRVLEYAAPTHDPAFLFPDLSHEELRALAPKVAPHHYIPAMNRLIVTIQIWVVRLDEKVIVIDTGVGNRKTRKAPRMHSLNSLVPEWLSAAGASFDQVTHVVQTHMHADHTGWNTVPDGEGGWKPAFPNARYLMPRTDFDYWSKKVEEGPDMTMDESWTDSVMPVVEAGLVDFVDDDAGEILPGITAEPVPGHSPGMMSYRLSSDGEEGLFCGDVFHSPLQILKPDLNTAYCSLPDLARQTRARVLAECVDRGTLLMPMHFGGPHCGHVRQDADGYYFEGASWPELRLP